QAGLAEMHFELTKPRLGQVTDLRIVVEHLQYDFVLAPSLPFVEHGAHVACALKLSDERGAGLFSIDERVPVAETCRAEHEVRQFGNGFVVSERLGRCVHSHALACRTTDIRWMGAFAICAHAPRKSPRSRATSASPALSCLRL